jgi:hypothetical protein
MAQGIEERAKALLDSAADLPSEVPTTQNGIYVLWLDAVAFTTLHLTPGLHNAGYAGVAQGSGGLRGRFSEEWSPKNSGRSSPRRTLGALLRTELDLHPRPRPGAATSRNADYYVFGDEGEARLSDWIASHGRFSYLPMGEENPGVVETRLIAYLQPPLNIDKWANPVAEDLRSLRKECRETSHKWLAAQGDSELED